ncbi:MAG: type II toxin-antitoxin system PemK/MazF family toxin [Nitrososphaerota archaeon]|nr:type II toxin-antitoxin system PemK/MazF family toxin [Nitrososphaerota archaeon]MDG7013845.1 type II toxin-antitoxin system PemK/MazF family toxin [Nitrososphaerota archaeon]MDG7025188.1 type II toxin-antitoxin system PemK/MazF family toxin [Nitrososphaerota archaeon]
MLESGEVVLVPFPFTDLSQIKRRPVLVLSSQKHNRTSKDFISCGITSNLENRRNSVLLDPSEMTEGSIPVRSRIKYDKIFTLEKGLVLKGLGKVSPQKLAKVKNGLISLLG